MTVFDHPDFRGHERVVFLADRASGLRAIIAIHSTALGDAAGGLRCLPYARPAFALEDALRLARTMTRRAAIAGVPLGGAQAVIMADPLIEKTEPLLEAFGRAVDVLDGAYTCAPDLGMTSRDMAVIGRATGHAIGVPGADDEIAQAAAYGMYQAIRAGALARLGRSDLMGLRVAIHGLGQVGMQLCGHLCDAGATLLVADPDPRAVRGAVAVFGAKAVPIDQALAGEVDLLASSLTGTFLDEAAASLVRASVICGAHPQLASPAASHNLQRRGILMVPDTLVSAGGAIGLAAAMLGEAEPVTRRKLEGLFEVCLRLLARAAQNGITPADAVEQVVQEFLSKAHAKSLHRLERAVA